MDQHEENLKAVRQFLGLTCYLMESGMLLVLTARPTFITLLDRALNLFSDMEGINKDTSQENMVVWIHQLMKDSFQGMVDRMLEIGTLTKEEKVELLEHLSGVFAQIDVNAQLNMNALETGVSEPFQKFIDTLDL